MNSCGYGKQLGRVIHWFNSEKQHPLLKCQSSGFTLEKYILLEDYESEMFEYTVHKHNKVGFVIYITVNSVEILNFIICQTKTHWRIQL